MGRGDGEDVRQPVSLMQRRTYGQRSPGHCEEVARETLISSTGTGLDLVSCFSTQRGSETCQGHTAYGIQPGLILISWNVQGN